MQTSTSLETPPDETVPGPAGQHRLTWFIDDGIKFELECLHPAGTACDRDALATLDADELMESHEGGKVPLRSGAIRSWWTGEPGAALLWWNYAEAAPAEPVPLPPVTNTRSAAPARRIGLNGHIGPDPRPRHLHELRFFLDDGWFTPELTCLHAPLDSSGFCDRDNLRDDGLLEYTHRGRTELRDGTIESWWEAVLDDFDLAWKYVDDPTHDQA